MAERDGAAIGVDVLAIVRQAEATQHRNALLREGFRITTIPGASSITETALPNAWKRPAACASAVALAWSAGAMAMRVAAA